MSKINKELDDLYEQPCGGVGGEIWDELPGLLRKYGYKHDVDMDEITKRMPARQIEKLYLELSNGSEDCTDWTVDDLYSWRF